MSSLFDPNKKSSGGSSDMFLTLKDGEAVTGVICGPIYEYYHLGYGKTLQVVDEHTEGASFKFRANFVSRENGKFVAKIIERGLTVYEQLAALEQAGYDLHKTTIRISRKGSKQQDTMYMVMPVPGGEINQGVLDLLKNVKLWELSREKKENKEEVVKTDQKGHYLDKEYNTTSESNYTVDEIPF